MKAAPFTYHSPQTRAELLTLLGDLDNARVLAGGQSLMPLLNLRLAAPDHLIDLNGVKDLDHIEIVGDRLRIGAMVRQRTAERSPIVAAACPLLVEALQHVGYQQTRNRGTIGGSIAHMDPTAELAVVAKVTDARLALQSRRGSRELSFDEFAAGYLATMVEPDEILAHVEFKCWPQHHGWAFDEVTRRGESFSMVSAAALVELNADGTIRHAALAVGGLGAIPMRVPVAESLLRGAVFNDELRFAAGSAAEQLPAESDLYASAEYKQHLAAVLISRTLAKAVSRARRPDRV